MHAGDGIDDRDQASYIFGFGVGGCFGAVGSWVVGWDFVVVGGFLCFGGLAVSFGLSCGLGFVVAMAWCLVLVLGVVFWWWRRARVYGRMCWAFLCVCLLFIFLCNSSASEEAALAADWIAGLENPAGRQHQQLT